jgi:hypothetical protein
VERLFVIRSGNRVDAELVTVGDVAERSGLSRPQVTKLGRGGPRRKENPFPSPLARTRTGPLWHWPDVAEWLEARERRRITDDERRIARIAQIEQQLDTEGPPNVLAAAAETTTMEDVLEDLTRLNELLASSPFVL